MICLLDTHAFIWAVLETSKLSKNIQSIITNKENEICVSSVSFWEISLKTRIKKFSFENIKIKDFPKYAKNMDFTIIDLQENETITFHELSLKENHKDPFDRMLIWQAITKNMIMLSKDGLFEQYKEDGLKLIW
jgi:PIN domain nuclease of toxin-antitoxin system